MNGTGDDTRHAVYFAPGPDSNLWRLGCRWHGRDPATGDTLEQPPVPNLDPAVVQDATASPRFYGFHATLKPPFALAPGTTHEELLAAMDALAARRPAFVAPPLAVTRLGRFLALTLRAPSPDMDTLAAACVTELDRFRAPQSEAELARRRQARLDPRQEALLVQWGYPYVLEEFRFHMTLTGSLDDEALQSRLRAFLESWFAPLAGEPLTVDSICLYSQPDRATPFRLERRFPLAG